MRGAETRGRGGACADGPPDETRIPVVVQPRASRSAVDVRADGSVRVRVTAPPVDGAANQAVCDLLARLLGCPRSAVEVVRGPAARHKVVRIRGLSPDAVGARLAAHRREA